ncbi:MAG: hypothetical protein WDM89_19415 [Rhizomicrobium sp.]
MKRELTRRGVELVDSYGLIQPTRNTLEDLGFEYDWSRSSPSEITEVVVATSTKQGGNGHTHPPHRAGNSARSARIQTTPSR